MFLSISCQIIFGKPVQAQRKYAHRAPLTLAELGQESDPPDVTLPGARTTRRPSTCPRLFKTQRNINSTLDIISFRSGIHSHVQRKVARVVLERCELEAAARPEPCPAPPKPQAPPPAQLPTPTPPPARTPSPHQPPSPERPTSALCLRNRKVRRVIWQRGKKKNCKKISRQAPELAESEEDHPLAYFAKRKASNKKAGPQSSSEIAPAVASPGGIASPSSAMSPLVYDESVVGESEVAHSSHSAPVSLNVAGEAEVAHSSHSASVSLYDFIINIFDWREAEQSEINDVETEANAAETIARVSDWLTRVEHGGATPSAGNNFKMPELPAWRVCPSHTDASSVVSRVPPPTRGEKLLRATCISWHHRHLCATLQDASYITRFCGECPRCNIMFKSLKSPLPTDIDDIMYDEARHINFASTLANAVSEEHSGAALKRLLTRNGKKIFKVALMLRDKSTNSGFTDSEQALVAEVITCLTECNAARPPPREPGHAPPASKRLNLLCLEESPIFTVSKADFDKGPTDYSNKILSEYPKTSLCGIRPPDSFQPGAVSARSNDTEQNFRVNNMYIHRMMMRMGPATKELVAIRRIQSSNYQRSPLFGGLEIDLVKLFHMVQREGGIEAVQGNEENWKKIARQMGLVCRNKTYSKLENIYFKYLLEWSSLRSDERQEAIKEVEECWSFRESNAMMRAQQPLRRQERMDLGVPDDDSEVPLPLETACAAAEECVTLGRNINIKAYKKLAEQVRLNHFDGCSGSVEEVEQRYWQLVSRADSHVCVHAGSVDAAAHDTGFPKDQASPYGMHPWNLKRVRFSNDNLLRYLGPCLGVSSSSIHYGMCFSSSCWHMDPTSVPWIEYLHEGAPKIWYSIAADQAPAFRKAAEAICPWAVLNKEIWLPSDLIMIPPKTLKEFGVQVHRHVQQPGEYVLVYPNTYSANICTGYTVSEGVYFAPYSWITSIETTFNKLRLSCEPSLFPMERLLISMAANGRTSRPLQLLIQPVLAATFKQEFSDRQRLIEKNMRLMSDEAFLELNMRRGSRQLQQNGECAYCRRHLFLSRVVGVVEGDLCSRHGLALYEQALARQERLDNATCILMVSNALMTEIINSLKQRILGEVTNPKQ